MTEYILIVVFVAIAVLIVLGIFKDNIKQLFRGTNAELQNVQVSPTPWAREPTHAPHPRPRKTRRARADPRPYAHLALQ